MATTEATLFALFSSQNQDGDRITQTDWVVDARTGSVRWTAGAPAKTIAVLGELLSTGTFGTGNRVATTRVRREGLIDNRATAGANWFEHVHVIPRTVDLENILTDQTINFEVFNGFREDAKLFSSFAVPAGSGITTSGLPSLPVSLFQLDTSAFDAIVPSSGPSTIDGDFTVVIGGETILVPITGNRIVMFPYQPEAPLTENLEFLTDILTRVDGTEQRVAVRKNPRQKFKFNVFADNDLERQRISNLLFDWQARVFGLPVWGETTRLTASVAVLDTVITVESTADADYRIGELAIILKNDNTFDALIVDSFTATTITFTSPATNAYAAGDSDVFVAPLRSALADSVVSRSKKQTAVESFQVNFTSIANDASLADTTGFTIHPTDSKIILDGAVKGIGLNATTGSTKEQMVRRVAQIDSIAGLFTQSSPWDRSKESSPLTFFVNSRDKLWDVRQLLHALRGQQISFYLPTFFKDLTANLDITSGGSTLQVDNTKYAQFCDGRVPRDLLRVTTDAGVEYIASITGSTEIDDDNESIAINVLLKDGVSAGPTWPDTVTVANIDRIDFVQKVRLDSDEITITHLDGAGQARISTQVTTVFE